MVFVAVDFRSLKNLMKEIPLSFPCLVFIFISLGNEISLELSSEQMITV